MTLPSKQQCFKLWTSYGVWMVLLDWMSWLEKIELQLMNKFFYEKAISRVCMSVDLPRTYFTWDTSKDCIYMVNLSELSFSSQNKSRCTILKRKGGLDLTKCMTVQVHQSLYAFRYGMEANWRQYTNLRCPSVRV